MEKRPDRDDPNIAISSPYCRSALKRRLEKTIASGRTSTQPRGKVRIIGGRWKRTPISVVNSPGLRPTPDRVRETVFNWLTHHFGGSLEACSVLDLFAGSGALGFEAASRGARPVLLVERSRAAAAALSTLRDRLGADDLELVEGDAFAACTALDRAGRRFSIVFLDPPFEGRHLIEVLAPAISLCVPDGVVYAESAEPLAESDLQAAGAQILRADRAGDVFYYLLRRKKQ